jgi:hypothetical protein
MADGGGCEGFGGARLALGFQYRGLVLFLTGAGGDLSKGRRRGRPSEISPVVTDVRDRPTVGPTCSQRRVRNGCRMRLSSGRNGQNKRLRCTDGLIRRPRSSKRCEAPVGGHHIYPWMSV